MIRRGLTLIETIIASFLLLSRFLVIVNLFHSGLGYTSRIENQQLATLIAERQLEQMRAWSETSSGTAYNFDTLAAVYNGQNVTVPDFGNFKLMTNVTARELYSACTDFERGSAVNGFQPRSLSNSSRTVDVTVAWDHGAHSLTLTSLLTQTVSSFSTGPNPINVTFTAAPSLPLAQNATLECQATGYDSNNRPIPDLFFTWNMECVNGSGTLTPTRDGHRVVFSNVVNGTGTTQYHTGGQLYIQARAKYNGRWASGSSTLVDLQ